jgi:murein DD-endopeptidase MepM/ murein hydrolase activator NlpD
VASRTEPPALRAPHAELQLVEPEPAPAAAQRQVPASPEVRHTVQAGQNLYRISLQYGCSVDALMAANGLKDPRELQVGQVLRIPRAASRAPAAVASSSARKEEGRAAVASRSEAQRAQASAGSRREASARVRGRVVPGGRERSAEAPSTRGMLQWPLRGVLYGRFGKKGREPHDGIDLAAPKGTPVRTASPGLVLYAGEQRGYGNIVLVEHANGLITLYAHNNDVRVRTGQTVREGQVVATVGESGRTSGPHLHFEVRRDGRPVDPLDFLGPIPAR